MPPRHIRDRDGVRIIISMYYDFGRTNPENRGHRREDHTGGVNRISRCGSVAAFDWDDDGDYDLLLSGSCGDLWLQMNEGTAEKSSFTGKCLPLKVAEKNFAAKAKVTNFRVVDWDGDGLKDIVYATSIDHNDKGSTNICILTNTGEAGKPKFDSYEVLIEGNKIANIDAPKLPDTELRIDIQDYNNDGKLDIIVAGTSVVTRKSDSKKFKARRVWVYTQKMTKPVDAPSKKEN